MVSAGVGAAGGLPVRVAVVVRDGAPADDVDVVAGSGRNEDLVRCAYEVRVCGHGVGLCSVGVS